MLKRVLFDYIRSFRWKNIVETYKSKYVKNGYNPLWSTFYLFVIIPMTNSITNAKDSLINLFVWGIPVLIGAYGMELLPLRLPKLMYLCPMNAEERKQYIRTVFWVRVLVPSLFELIAGGMLLFLGVIPPLFVLFAVFGGISTMFVYSFSKQPMTFRGIPVDERWKEFCSFMGIMLSMLIMLFTCIIAKDYTQQVSGWHYGVIILVTILAVIDVLCLRALPMHIEKNATYEERFMMLKEKQS